MIAQHKTVSRLLTQAQPPVWLAGWALAGVAVQAPTGIKLIPVVMTVGALLSLIAGLSAVTSA